MISFYQELTWNFAEKDTIPWGPVITAEYSSTGDYRASLIQLPPWGLEILENEDTCKAPRHAQEYA